VKIQILKTTLLDDDGCDKFTLVPGIYWLDWQEPSRQGKQVLAAVEAAIQERRYQAIPDINNPPGTCTVPVIWMLQFDR
jgi:hypothetical protein